MLTFEVDSFSREELDEWKDKRLKIDIKIDRKKRSQNANKMMWSLCSKIAEKIYSTSEDVYRQAVRHVGICVDYPNLDEVQLTTLDEQWRKNGIAWFTEVLDYEADGDRRTLRCYKGSSSYDTKQMSLLIDFLIEEGKELGIDTMSDREKSLLLEQWEKEKK